MIGAQARHLGDLRVYDFSRCDVVVPYPWTFAGGGNRLRRRIHDAVGPERKNSQPYSEKLDEAGGWTAWDGSYVPSIAISADAYETSPFWTLTRTTTNGSELWRGHVAAALADSVWSMTFAVLGTASSTEHDFGLWHTASGWGGSDLSVARILSGPGTLTQVVGAAWRISNLSTTVPTIVHLTRQVVADGDVFPMFAPGSGTAPTIGHSTKITRVHVGEGPSLGPYISTLAAPATTTDWPRVNELSQDTTYIDAEAGYTASVYNGGSGVIVQGRRPNGVTGAITRYSGPAGTVARFQIDGSAEAPTSRDRLGFVWARAANSSASVRTDVNDQDGRDWTLSSKWQCIGGFAAAGVLPYRFLDVDLFDGQPIELAWAYIAVNDSGLTEFPVWHEGVVVTPPFGEIVAVPEGQPRIEYGPDGVGLGFKASGAQSNLNDNGDDLQSGWILGGGLVRAPMAVNSVVGGTASLLEFPESAGAWSLFHPYNGLEPGLRYTWSADVQLGTATNFCVVPNDTAAWNTLLGAHSFSVADGLNKDYPVRVSISAVANHTTSINIHLGHHEETSLVQQSPGTVIVSNVMFTVGATADYVKSPPGTSSAESLETFDLQALELHNGRGTILVDFIMPETSGTARGIMSCCNTSGVEWMGIYTGGVNVNVQCVGGVVRYSNSLGPFSKGDRVRAALTFDTGYFASAVNGVPGPVTHGNNPIAYDRVIEGDLVGPRAYPADTTISRAGTTGRVMTLGELVEGTAL